MMLSLSVFLPAALICAAIGPLRPLGPEPASAARPSASPATDGKADFEAVLQQVKRTVDSHHFKEAKELLLSKLAEHKDKDYVRPHLDEIREDLKLCSFSLQHPRKQPGDVLCGEVTAYDAKTGQISVVWRKDAKGKDGKPAPKFPCDDFETVKEEHVLKVPFDGPFSLTLAGKALGQTAPKVRLCIREDSWYEALLDAGDLSKLIKVSGDERKTLADPSTSGMNVARPYVLKYTVRDTQIEASFNGSRMLMGPKAKGEFGQLAFRDVAELERIEVSGKVKIAWLDEKIDAIAKKELVEFEKTYDAKADLPDWLR
jgi:hypothetical protein